MENTNAILQAIGYSLKDVVQTSVYLSSMKQFEEFNVEYAKYFSDEPPALVTVETLMPKQKLLMG
jgi:2-iminobutanoate/2-iminopropanoate deaminase